jgi:phosphoglycolate phosphatase-like HAD superfamily hydrolase
MAHLVWDWNGTLLDDLALVVAATNTSLATAGGRNITVEEHRRDFRRPIWGYYSDVLGWEISRDEFVALDHAFHLAYRDGLDACPLALDARTALAAWSGSQSLLSMWFHHELVPLVTRYGLDGHLSRVDGLRDVTGGGAKAPHLVAHLARLGIAGEECVLIGDSVDDAEAATSVGARVVLYSGGITDEARLRATGHPVVATLTEAVRVAATTG